MHRDAVSASLVPALRRLGRERGATLYMTLLAGFAALLARYTGQSDIVIGSPIANRHDEALRDLIGLFVNTLVVRVRVELEQSFEALFADVRQTTLESYRHQDVPFERIVELVAPARRLNLPPLVQVGFALQNAPWTVPQLDGLYVEPMRIGDVRVRSDLELHIWDRPPQLTTSWFFNRDLFDAWRIEQMSQHYLQILAAMVDDPGQRVGDVALAAPSEERWGAGSVAPF